MEFVGGDYDTLPAAVDALSDGSSLIIRNCSYFGPLEHSKTVPIISLLQDIFLDGPQREMQMTVMHSSRAVVFNSGYTKSKYNFSDELLNIARLPVIPLPVDFSLFEPGNPMGLQQALSLPDGAVCWIGACEGATGRIKGWDIFLQAVRLNPDIPFVAVFKDKLPDYAPANLRMYVRVTHEDLMKIIGACRVGLCTSRSESQHLAGIEMGACGLPMVAPRVGVYYDKGTSQKHFPGVITLENTIEQLTASIRTVLSKQWDAQTIRADWQKDFDRPVIKAAWEKLVEEVECSGLS